MILSSAQYRWELRWMEGPIVERHHGEAASVVICPGCRSVGAAPHADIASDNESRASPGKSMVVTEAPVHTRVRPIRAVIFPERRLAEVHDIWIGPVDKDDEVEPPLAAWVRWV